MKKEDVRLTVDNGVLTISGERKYEQKSKGEASPIEHAYREFRPQLLTPGDADRSKVTADYKDGALHVHLPKSQKAKPKLFEIKVS